jgi:RNA 3'-terminal phosphate cyclase
MKAFEPNTKRREHLVKLRAYVAEQPNGARVSWVEIETATGVEMRTQLSRGLFRMACHREKRGYLPLPGGGVEFSCATNAVEVVDRYNKRVMGAVKSASVKGGYVVARHVGELAGDEAKALLRAASLSSTLMMVGRQAKAMGEGKKA